MELLGMWERISCLEISWRMGSKETLSQSQHRVNGLNGLLFHKHEKYEK